MEACSTETEQILHSKNPGVIKLRYYSFHSRISHMHANMVTYFGSGAGSGAHAGGVTILVYTPYVLYSTY